MILKIAAFSDPATIASLAPKLAPLEWRDGGATAGKVARAVKRNLQARMDNAAGRAIAAALMPILSDNSVLEAAARPRRFSPLMISKTMGGGYYGAHVDNALMGRGRERLRTDLSFTLYLSNACDYEGGELVIHTAGMTHELTGNWGELVLYPSTSIHEVRPVTSGERVVAIGWIESLIADPAARELLFDMENLRTALRSRLELQSPEMLTLDKTIANLSRMWSKP